MPDLTILLLNLARQTAEDNPVIVSLDWPAFIGSLAALVTAGGIWYKTRQEKRKGRADVIQSLDQTITQSVERGMKLNERVASLEDDLFKTKNDLRETCQKLDETQNDLEKANKRIAENEKLLGEARGVIDSQREYIENVEAEKADIMSWAEELVGQLKEANIEPLPFRWKSRSAEPPVPGSGRRK